MASFKHRQPSDTNQSVPETESVPETHSYQEKHFQPTLNEPVVETEQYTEYGATVKPDPTRARSNPTVKSDVTERSDQPGEEDVLAKDRLNRSLQGNSDSGTQYSTPDVGSGVSSGSEGYAHTYGSVGSTSAAASSATATAAATATATSTVAAGAASAVVAGAGAVLIAVTLIIPMVLGVPSAIIFEDIVATDSSIYYSIYFEDYEEGMELYVSLHNNFTDRTHTVESESFSFVERDLKPNMEYTLTVYGSMSAVLKEQVIKTKPSTDVPTLTVNYCDYLPEKGVVSFSSTISGDTAAWGDYRAVLYAEDKDGAAGGMRQIASVMLESVDTEQEIRFQLEKDASYDATFAIECSGQDGTETLYSAPMKVYGSPYFGFNAEFDSSTDVLNISSTVYDPDGVRSEYFAIITVTNASEPSQSYTDSRDLSSGGCEFTNVSNGYTFYDFEVRLQCYEGGQFVDITDRYFTYSSYSSPAFGNVKYDFVHTSSAATGMYGGTLTITYDLVDHNGQYTQLHADLGDKAGTGWAQSLNFNNTLPHEISFDVNEEGCGTDQPLTIWNGDTKLYEGTVSLVCNDSRFSVSTVETAENSTEQTVNKANLDLYADYYDADRAYSGIAYTIVQGSKSTGEISFTPSRNGATRLSFDSSGFVNGAAQLNITYKENGTGKALPAIDVNVYVGPTATLGSYSYDESASIATVNLTITDQFNAWSNLKANLDRQTTTPSGTNSITCNGAPLSNTVTSIEFPLVSSQDGNMLNTPLVFSLWIMGDEEVKVFESADTITLPFSDMDGYSADARDPSTGRGLDFTFDVYDPMSQWSNYSVTVTQGTTQLYTGAVAPGDNVLTFGDIQFDNGQATLVLTCSTASGTKTLLDEEVQVYFGPTLSNGNTQYSGTSAGGTVTIPVTLTQPSQFDAQGRIRLYYETPSGVEEVTSNETVPQDNNTYTFNVNGDFLNRTLSMDMVDGAGKHSSLNTLSVTVQYAYISLESPPEPTDPYGTTGRGIRLTIYGGGLDGLQIKASVQQGTTVLRSDYNVPTGMEILVPFDNVTFSNGPATLSFSYGNRISIPFANGDEEMTVDVYYGPVIESVTTAYDASTTTGTVTLTVTDPFDNIVGKNVRLTVAGAPGPMDSEMTIGSGSNTVTFTVPLDSPYINADMSVSVVDKSETEVIVCQPYGYVQFKYVHLESSDAVPSGPMEETITLTLAGDASLYDGYQVTIIQEITGVTIVEDKPITFELDPTSGTYVSTVSMAGPSFGNGPAVLTLSCLDAVSGQRINIIENKDIQVYYGAAFNDVTASYDADQGIGTLTIDYEDDFGEWNGYYGKLAIASSSVESNESIDSNRGIITFTIPVTSPLINRDITLQLVDGPGGEAKAYGPYVRFDYTGSTVADIALSYNGAAEIGTANFTIVDPQGAWPNSLTLALVPENNKIGPGVEASISKSDTSAQFSIATDSPYLNTEMYLVLRGDTEYYRSTATYTFDYADIMGFNWTILEDGPSPALKGISGTVLVSGPESMLSNYQIQIDQNDITIYSGTFSTRPTDRDMTFSQYAVNGPATVHITATRQGSVVSASYDTTITVYTGLSVNSIDGRGTDNQGTGQILYDITYQGNPAYIEVNVGTQSEDWKRATGSIVDGTGSLTIDLESTRVYNTSLPTRLVYEDGSLISDTTPNVIFKYASMSINTVDPLDPAQGSRGLSAVGVNINDPHSLWTDYRAVVTDNVSGDTLYDGDFIVNQENNIATIIIDTQFENGYGTLRIYCTADGVEDTEVYSKTVELYNGPTVTVTGSPVLDTSAGSSTFSATLYGRFNEFGVVSDDTGTGNMDLIAVIDLNEGRVLSTSFYDVTSHVVTIEFNDGNLVNHVGEELTLSIYQVEIGPSGDTPTGDAIASTTIVFTGSGN
ncbi:MAG: hypothetical protein II855_08640 [Candidatus Methanomethylophilaceae archaeon]|nr:hypothetical protein [Candidatus Methanomethylophilaceae archaeon]